VAQVVQGQLMPHMLVLDAVGRRHTGELPPKKRIRQGDWRRRRWDGIVEMGAEVDPCKVV
jgi:hypothetical protein